MQAERAPTHAAELPVREAQLPDLVGRLQIIGPLASAHITPERPVFVWLPSDYHADARLYPVVYMQDGQNLFSDALAFGREWQVDETVERLGALGLRAIVVGIPNAGEARLHEYNPFADETHGGEGYLRFILEDVMPVIEARYRVSTSRADTGIVGSSLGALIALYAFFRYPERFGFVGALSPALWWADEQLLSYVARRGHVEGRIYLDIGIEEGGEHVARVHALHRQLVASGYRPGPDLFYVEDINAAHDEAAWARRLHTALYFLLSPAAAGSTTCGSADRRGDHTSLR